MKQPLMKLVFIEIPSLITLPVNRECLLDSLSLVVGYSNKTQIGSKLELELWQQVPNFITSVR